MKQYDFFEAYSAMAPALRTAVSAWHSGDKGAMRTMVNFANRVKIKSPRQVRALRREEPEDGGVILARQAWKRARRIYWYAIGAVALVVVLTYGIASLFPGTQNGWSIVLALLTAFLAAGVFLMVARRRHMNAEAELICTAALLWFGEKEAEK